MENKIKCFLSYSHENRNIDMVNEIYRILTNSSNFINYSENEDKSNFSNDTIWNYLQKKIKGSSCTILLLTNDLLSYNRRKLEPVEGNFLASGWIYNEISASLRDWEDNRINGLVCVYDDIQAIIYQNWVYQLPDILRLNLKYIVFVSYSTFISNPNCYIQKAILNREKQINSNNTAFDIIYDLHSKR